MDYWENLSRKRSNFVFIGAALLAVILVTGVFRPVYGDGPLADYESDQIVIKLVSGASVADVNNAYGTTILKTLLNSSGIYLLQAPVGSSAEQIVQAMAGDTRLQYAELNLIGAAPEANAGDIFAWPDGGSNTGTSGTTSTQTLTSDSREVYNWEWSQQDYNRYHNQPAVQAINLGQAQSISQGAGSIIAVLDTGVDLNHPVLVPHLTGIRYDFVDDDGVPADIFNGRDNDNDGIVDEVAGHGTHVAGIIHLVAPGAQIMPLRVLDSEGHGNIFVVAEAILFAVQNGADVIHLSLGTPQNSAFFDDVVELARANGVALVGSAGNMGADVPQFPAAADCALSVTAVGPGMLKATYASYGAWVDVSAPGESIYSTYPGGDFAQWDGTSMAAPFVSGQVALIHSYDATLSLEQVGQLVAGTAVSVDNANTNYVGLLGAGRIDIGASLTALANGQWPVGGANPLVGCD